MNSGNVNANQTSLSNKALLKRSRPHHLTSYALGQKSDKCRHIISSRGTGNYLITIKQRSGAVSNSRLPLWASRLLTLNVLSTNSNIVHCDGEWSFTPANYWTIYLFIYFYTSPKTIFLTPRTACKSKTRVKGDEKDGGKNILSKREKKSSRHVLSDLRTNFLETKQVWFKGRSI